MTGGAVLIGVKRPRDSSPVPLQTSVDGNESSCIPVGCSGEKDANVSSRKRAEERVAATDVVKDVGLREVVDDDDDKGTFVMSEKETPKFSSPKPVELIIDDGEGSSDHQIFCSICMEDRPSSKTLSMNGCSHAFCRICTVQYLTVKILQTATQIGCPHPGCKDGTLEPVDCQAILTPVIFERWCRNLCWALVLGSGGLYCPFNDCSALLIPDHAGGAVTEAVCLHCSRTFCAQCRGPWHETMTCEDYKNFSDDEFGKEDLMLKEVAKENRWQRCPSCGFFVEKTEGCNSILCRCGHHFCYVCGTSRRDNSS